MKTPDFIVQLPHKCLKYIYTLVLYKQTFNIKYLDTSREGFLKSVVKKNGNSGIILFNSFAAKRNCSRIYRSLPNRDYSRNLKARLIAVSF